MCGGPTINPPHLKHQSLGINGTVGCTESNREKAPVAGKTATQVIQNLLWFEQAAVVINPDMAHSRLFLELGFVEHLMVGECHGRSLPNFINILFEEQHASGCRLLTPPWESVAGRCPCLAQLTLGHFISVTWETDRRDPGDANIDVNPFSECTCHPAVWPLHYHKRNLLERFLVFPWCVPARLWDAAPSRLPHAGLHGRLGTLFVP